MSSTPRLASWLLPAIGLGLVAACSQAPATAVRVGDQNITMKQVDQVTADCLPSFQGDAPGEVREVVVNGLYSNAVAAAVTEKTGKSVPADELERFLASAGGDKLPATCRDAVVGTQKLTMLVNQVGAQVAAPLIGGLEVSVNPAVGKLDPTKARVRATSGSLSSIGQVYGVQS